MRNRIRPSFLSAGSSLLLATAMLSAPVHAGEESACDSGAGEATALLIQARYEGIRDIQADFSQTNESVTFGGEPLMSPETKTGEVLFAKPGKMRWTYQAPEQSVVVSDGSTLWIYDVDAESVTRLKVTSGFLSGAALQFLLGDGVILQTFEVRAVRCETHRVSLDLVPKAAATYERLGLVVDSRTGEVLATSVLDLFGNLTRIEFSEIQTNLTPDPKAFEFEAPEGVEVIDYDNSPMG